MRPVEVSQGREVIVNMRLGHGWEGGGICAESGSQFETAVTAVTLVRR